MEIEFEYPKAPGNEPNADPSTWKKARSSITLELAPLNVMPHTVNLFLQQVHHGLWDGCRIVHNARHIIQVGPSYADKNPNEADQQLPHYDKFYKMGLDKVSFQEYNVNYPHDQWTVGLAGRPGGPDFYINKINNTDTHGPGGQPNPTDIHAEADPCFAKIINDGHKVLEEIDSVPTTPGNKRLEYPVTIVSAKILAHGEGGGPEDEWKEIKAGERYVGEDDDNVDNVMPFPDVPHGV